MTELRRRFINELKLRNRSVRTTQSYVSWIYRLAKYYRQSPDTLSIDQIREFLGHLAGQCNLSASTLNQALNAIVFFYRELLGWDVKDQFTAIKRPRNDKQLPKVYSQSEIYQILTAARDHDIKAHLLLMLLYSTGLRVGELCALKWRHVEWDRKILRVEHGKGGKDRILPLSPLLENRLKKYERFCQKEHHRPVFVSRTGGVLLPGCVTHHYNKALKRSSVVRRGGVHCIRHSYATHQLERGVDINTLRVLLGHSNIQTTMVYLQVSQNRSQALGTPLDELMERFEISKRGVQ